MALARSDIFHPLDPALTNYLLTGTPRERKRYLWTAVLSVYREVLSLLAGFRRILPRKSVPIAGDRGTPNPRAI